MGTLPKNWLKLQQRRWFLDRLSRKDQKSNALPLNWSNSSTKNGWIYFRVNKILRFLNFFTCFFRHFYQLVLLFWSNGFAKRISATLRAALCSIHKKYSTQSLPVIIWVKLTFHLVSSTSHKYQCISLRKF